MPRGEIAQRHVIGLRLKNMVNWLIEVILAD